MGSLPHWSLCGSPLGLKLTPSGNLEPRQFSCYYDSCRLIGNNLWFGFTKALLNLIYNVFGWKEFEFRFLGRNFLYIWKNRRFKQYMHQLINTVCLKWLKIIGNFKLITIEIHLTIIGTNYINNAWVGWTHKRIPIWWHLRNLGDNVLLRLAWPIPLV